MPAIPTAYTQSCPVCGRLLRVPVRLLGKTAACHHCEATFVARDANGDCVPTSDPRAKLMERADQLLNACRGLHPVGVVDSTMRVSQF